MKVRSNLPVSWLSLRVASVNHGNLIIDEATWAMLGHPQRSDYSSFYSLTGDEIDEINRSPALVLPGATLLDPSEHAIATSLLQVRCPKFAVGVALCTTTSRLVDLSIAFAIAQPIGSRDPFTHAVLKSAGIESHFVGCSTLTIGDAENWTYREGPVIFSLGRGDQAPLQRCVVHAAQHSDVVVLQHVPRLQPNFDCSPRVTWIHLRDTVQLKQIYGRASMVVTGRIHGALPAIALGVPVLFYGDYRDSRFSIIEHLGIECVPPEPNRISSRIREILTTGMIKTEPLDRAAVLRDEMRRFVELYWTSPKT